MQFRVTRGLFVIMAQCRGGPGLRGVVLRSAPPRTVVVASRAPATRLPARRRREVMPSFRYTFRRW